MFQELEAMFDGTALQLEVPLNLDPGTRVRVTVESVLPKEQKQPKTFLQNLDIEFELEDDGRWIAEVINLPGVLA